LTEVHSLTDFLRNTKSHMSRLKRSKRPLVLTVNGRAELIVQDARSYQALLELADRAGGDRGYPPRTPVDGARGRPTREAGP
jgi:hypothetical protein